MFKDHERHAEPVIEWNVAKANPLFAKTDFMVEADQFALATFLGQLAGERFSWAYLGPVQTVIVDRCVGRPVYVDLTWLEVNGKTVLFYYPVSMFCDWNLVNVWRHGAFGWEIYKDRHCTALDFHRCLDYCRG